ncbi:MAG: phospholipase D-like domain-containing protein [Thiogranum sp.]
METTYSFELFTEGDVLYEAMLASIGEARNHVLLESYIFADDEVGHRFADALVAAAGRGVIVRLHLDAAGSLFWHTRRLSKRLRHGGLRLRWFHRWDWHHPWRYNRRNHRKLLVIDGDTAYVGGFNIHRESSRIHYGERRWRDTHIRMRGPLARDAMDLFGRFWIGRKRPIIAHPLHANHILLTNYSLGARRLLNGTFASILSHARRTIFLTTPYFVPQRNIQRQIADAAARGVDVRLLVPLKSDVPLAQWAARAAYSGLLASGVRIYEYQPRVLHAKSIVVDGDHATVGTANIDYRSFFLNYELNLFTRDTRLCRELEKVFRQDLALSAAIHGEHWSHRPWTQKFLELIGWLARRWL